MAKKLLIRTPQTIDGTNLRYDANKQVVYKTSIVELAARKNIINLNARLKEHLHHIIEEIEVEDKPIGLSNEDLRKRLAELEATKENKELKARIAELEGKLNGGAEDASKVESDSTKLTVIELVAKIKEATTVDEVNAVAAGDTRKGVTDAATKRIAELEAK